MCRSSLEDHFKVVTVFSFLFHFFLIFVGGIGLSSKWDIKLYYGIFAFSVITTGAYTILLPQAFESDRLNFEVYDHFLIYQWIVQALVIILPSVFLITVTYDDDVVIGGGCVITLQAGFLVFFLMYRCIRKKQSEKSAFRDLDIRTYATFQLRSERHNSLRII